MLPLHKKVQLSHDTAKPFPFSDQAEKFVLGALLVDKGAMVRIASDLSPKHFYNDKQSAIYGAMYDLFKKGESIDILTTLQRFQLLHPKIELKAYDLVELQNRTVYTAENIEAHAEVVKNKWAQREMMRIGNKMLYLASAPTQDVKEMLGTFGSELMQLNREALPDKTESDADILKRILDEAMTPKKGIKGLPTGIGMLDELTDGLEKGDFVVIGGRPGMGKTAMLVTISQYLAFDAKTPVAFFSYEMTKEKIFQRIISLRAQVDSRKIGKEELSPTELEAVKKATNEIYDNSNFHFINGRGLDVVGLRAKALTLAESEGVKAIFIDYLQRIPILKSMGRKSTHDAIGENTKALSELALELNIPVVTPCQLGRKSTEGNPRPTLTSLRDSGKIEDDAVKVWFIHRPEYYGIERFENDDPTKGKAEIIQAKNRNGELGNVVIDFDAPTTKFYSDDSGVIGDYFDNYEDDFEDVPF